MQNHAGSTGPLFSHPFKKKSMLFAPVMLCPHANLGCGISRSQIRLPWKKKAKAEAIFVKSNVHIESQGPSDLRRDSRACVIRVI